MIGISFAAGVGISTVGGLLLSTLVQGAEIKVLASVALTAALNELAPQYERTTGNKLSLGYSLVADIRKRVLEGETADVIILSRPVMDELQKQDKLTPGSIADVAGIAVAANDPRIVMTTTFARWGPGDSVFRSVDGGETWTELKMRNPDPARDVFDGGTAPYAAAIT